MECIRMQIINFKKLKNLKDQKVSRGLKVLRKNQHEGHYKDHKVEEGR